MKTCTTCGKEWPDEFRLCPSDGSSLRTSSSGTDLVDSIIADRYHISKKLGAGGMGTVYLGEHVKMGQQAAIKVIMPALAADPAAVARFTREARNAARIKHPNVCTIHDFGETPDGLIYMAMEFIEGESLAGLLQREGRLSLGRAAQILMQCSEALQAAHDLDIVHRDIKPENIMITKSRDGSDVVKVVDFGIAKAVTPESGQTVTQTGFIVGTPDYMSPDQVSGAVLDGRSDIYSLAVVFFRMVTGALPFDTKTPQDALMARIGAEPMKLLEALPEAGFTPELQRVLDNALAQRRENRYATAIEFGHAVVEAVRGNTATIIAPSLASVETQRLATPQPTPGPVTPETPQPVPSQPAGKRRVPLVATLLGAVVVVGGLAVVWRVTSTDDGAPVAGTDTTIGVVTQNAIKEEGVKPETIETGTVIVSGLPDGGTILAMGRELESPFALPAGRHEVELRAPGYEAKTISIDVVAGERMTLIYAARRVQQARTPPPAPPVEVQTRDRGRTVRLGQTVSGNLSSTDPTMQGRHVQEWSLQATAGQRVDITMRSGDFDAYLYLLGPGISEPLQDDDGADGTNSRLTTTLRQAGTYRVLASALAEGGTGTYSLSVTTPATLRDLAPRGRRLTLGETASGALSSGDATFQGRHVQAWALRAPAGARLEITMRSDEFDPFLYLIGPGITEPLADDDGAGNSDARIRATLERGGNYLVVASQYAGGTEGRYTISVTRPGAVRVAAAGRSLAVGQTVNGTLTGEGQPFEGRRVQAWTLQIPGPTRVDITMRSSAFDSYLYLAGPGLDDPLSDDDGADDTNSRISASLTGGTYYVMATAYDSDLTGPYTLSVAALLGLEQLPRDSRILSTGTTITGRIDQAAPVYEGRHVRIFELRAAPGTRIRIATIDAEFDTFLYLTGPGITEPLTDDDGGDGANAAITTTLQVGGTYFVAVGGYGEDDMGAYTLAVSPR